MVALSQNVDLKAELKKNFGFEGFKGEQEQIITDLMGGKDVFVLMPTGGGKSLCYQLPAIISEGTAIVVSPLIALMKNQVDLVRNYNESETVAHFYNSTLTVTQKRQVELDVREGKTKLLYVAPETLSKEDNIRFLMESKISFIAIDEAHCISEWGHDFRPEYRKIRTAINKFPETFPIIALTATATPKVQTDIVKNLQLNNHKLFVSSFNRENLYYEIRHKLNDDWAIKNIVQFIKTQGDKSGIIYVLNRKSAEKIAELLQVNGIIAAPYHAGLDSKTRSKAQDDFLNEEVNVIVATIAFGMGIDKPDIRFVIHFNIAKSLENYYQETGRAGRDGLEGNCIAYFNYKDISKIEKLLNDKSVTERERGMVLIDETVAYIESGQCRRKFILNYFGQSYTESKCSDVGMCDNCKNPKEQKEVSKDLAIILSIIEECPDSHFIQHFCDIAMGKNTDAIKAYKHHELKDFGFGSDKSNIYWTSVLRKAIIENYVYREIEEYGTLKMTEKGLDFIKNPIETTISLNHDYVNEAGVIIASNNHSGLDKTLYNILIDVRKKEAKKLNKPPYIIIQAPALEEMCIKYPITKDDFSKITGVTSAMVKKFHEPFCSEIKNYVESNNIDRPDDFIVKTTVNRSKDKVKIINSIDKKISLEVVAKELNLSFEEFVNELMSIVISGTKVNIDYYLNDILDEELLEEMLEYYEEDEKGDIQACYEEFVDDDLPYEDIKLVKIKFISDNIL